MVPDPIRQLAALTRLNLSGNRELLSPPQEVLTRAPGRFRHSFGRSDVPPGRPDRVLHVVSRWARSLRVGYSKLLRARRSLLNERSVRMLDPNWATTAS